MSKESELIEKIISNYGNAIEMPEMELWLKKYAMERYANKEVVPKTNNENMRNALLKLKEYFQENDKTIAEQNMYVIAHNGLIGVDVNEQPQNPNKNL